MKPKRTRPSPKPRNPASLEPTTPDDILWDRIYHHPDFADIGARRVTIICNIAARVYGREPATFDAIVERGAKAAWENERKRNPEKWPWEHLLETHREWLIGEYRSVLTAALGMGE